MATEAKSYESPPEQGSCALHKRRIAECSAPSPVIESHLSSGDLSIPVIEPINAERLATFIFERARNPIAVVDMDGKLLWAAVSTVEVLKVHRLVAPCQTRVAVPSETLQPMFERFLKSSEDGKCFVVRRECERDWIVIRVHACEFGDRPARILRYALSSETVDCSRNGIAEHFCLTPTEVAVLNRYARLPSPEALAQDMGIARETVRSHLKRIRSKTGVHGGRELIQLIATFEQNH